MCQLLKLKSIAMTGKTATLLLILVLCFAECAAELDFIDGPELQLTSRIFSGSCLSYGHSCWGGHGKRNGDDISNEANVKDGADTTVDTKWILSRLLQAPLNLRSWKNGPSFHKVNTLDLPAVFKNEMSNDVDTEALDSLPQNDDPMYPDESSVRHKQLEDKIKFFKLFQKSINRLN